MTKVIMIIEMEIYTNEIEKSELSKEIKDCKKDLVDCAISNLPGRLYGLNVQKVRCTSFAEKI
jgi:hypothetical protein